MSTLYIEKASSSSSRHRRGLQAYQGDGAFPLSLTNAVVAQAATSNSSSSSNSNNYSHRHSSQSNTSSSSNNNNKLSSNQAQARSNRVESTSSSSTSDSSSLGLNPSRGLGALTGINIDFADAGADFIDSNSRFRADNSNALPGRKKEKDVMSSHTNNNNIISNEWNKNISNVANIVIRWLWWLLWWL